jgi:hypothetical protein
MSDPLNVIRRPAVDEPAPYSLSLIVAPEDEAVFLAAGRYPGKRGRVEECAFYAVIHRRFGLWTHLYRVVPADTLNGFIVYLEKAFAGDTVPAARDWLRQALTR